MPLATIHIGGNSLIFDVLYIYYVMFVMIRGYIWLNINYLAVVSLKHYAAHANLKTTRARCSDLYSTLRSRLLDTVLGEYER